MATITKRIVIMATNWQRAAWALIQAKPGTHDSEVAGAAFRKMPLSDQLRCRTELYRCRAAKRGEVEAELTVDLHAGYYRVVETA